MRNRLQKLLWRGSKHRREGHELLLGECTTPRGAVVGGPTTEGCRGVTDARYVSQAIVIAWRMDTPSAEGGGGVGDWRDKPEGLGIGVQAAPVIASVGAARRTALRRRLSAGVLPQVRGGVCQLWIPRVGVHLYVVGLYMKRAPLFLLLCLQVCPIA